MTDWSFIIRAMPDPKPRRARRRDIRPDEILAAALAEFSAHGFAATRIDDIAARADVAKGTIYLHFAGKQALFEAVVRRHILPNLEEIERLVATWDGPTSALMREISAYFTRLLASDLTAIPKLVLTEAAAFPELARFWAENVVRRGLGLFASVIERGMARGEFRRVDARAVAPSFFAPMLVMALWKHSMAPHVPAPFAPGPVLAAQLELFLRGLAGGEGAP